MSRRDVMDPEVSVSDRAIHPSLCELVDFTLIRKSTDNTDKYKAITGTGKIPILEYIHLLPFKLSYG